MILNPTDTAVLCPDTQTTRSRVLLADDHDGIRERVRRLLEFDFDVVGEVPDGRSLLTAVEELKPDVVVLDICMPELSGIEAAEILRVQGCDAKLVFLSVNEDPDFVADGLAAGAQGYVVKSRMVSDLVTAIRRAETDQRYVSPTIAWDETD